MKFSAAALWQAPRGKEMEVLKIRAFATVPPQKTFQRGALVPSGIGSASSAFARVYQRLMPVELVQPL